MTRDFSALSQHLLLALFSLLWSLSCYSAEDRSPRILTIGLPTKPTNLNFTLRTGTWDLILQRDLNEALVRYVSSTKTVQPAHAESWKYDRGSQVYTFHLQSNLAWSDGVKIDARDYVRSWRYYAQPGLRSNCAGFLKYVENGVAVKRGEKPSSSLGIRAVGERSVEIKLVSHPSYLLTLLSSSDCFPIPFHRFSELELNALWQGAKVPSSGPYMMASSLDGDVEIVFVKNPMYWNKAALFFDEVHWVSYEKSPNMIARDLLNESIQMAYNMVGNSNTEWMTKNRPQWRKEKRESSLEYLSFSPKSLDNPAAKSHLIRKALSMAINRKAMVSASLSHQAVSEAITIAPSSYYSQATPIPDWYHWKFKRRQEAAKEIMREQGYSLSLPLQITYHVNAEQGRPQMAKSISAMWRAIGVNATIVINPISEHYKVLNSGAFKLARQGWFNSLGTIDYFFKLLRPIPPYNQRSLGSAKVQVAMKSLESLADAKLIEKQQLEIEKKVQEETLLIPLFHARKISFVNPKLIGYSGESWWFRDLESIRWADR